MDYLLLSVGSGKRNAATCEAGCNATSSREEWRHDEGAGLLQGIRGTWKDMLTSN